MTDYPDEQARRRERPSVTAQEYADAVSVSVRTVRRWCDDGLIPGAVRTGTAWLIPAGTPVPFTTPRHMRPRARTIPGEVVPAPLTGLDNRPDHRPGTEVSPRFAAEVAPAAPPAPTGAAARWTPEGPLFYTFAEVLGMCGGGVDESALQAMLRDGYIRGERRGARGPSRGRRAWLIPAGEIQRLRGHVR